MARACLACLAGVPVTLSAARSQEGVFGERCSYAFSPSFSYVLLYNAS